MHSTRSYTLLFFLLTCSNYSVCQEEPIHPGVLYSSIGTMAVSEARLRDALLMMIDEQNKRGGLLGRPLEAQAIGLQLWVEAAEHAQTVEPAEVRNALPGLEVANLSGGRAKMHANHHLSKPVYIGQIRPDGQYDVIWQSNGSVTGDPWFDPVSAHTEEERQ